MCEYLTWPPGECGRHYTGIVSVSPFWDSFFNHLVGITGLLVPDVIKCNAQYLHLGVVFFHSVAQYGHLLIFLVHPV